jgi:hypothetical protein
MRRIRRGAPTTIVCGSLSFDRVSLKPITQLLPSFILMKADQAHTFALHNTMQALTTEMAEQAPGSEVVMTRLARGSVYPGTPGVHRDLNKSIIAKSLIESRRGGMTPIAGVCVEGSRGL